MKSKILSLVLSISFLSMLSECLAQPPEVPHAFYGTVSFIDGPAPSGMIVIAKINGIERGRAIISNGSYGPYLYVTDPGDEVKEGDTIYFYVNGIQANENAKFYNGNITRLDLTLNASVPKTSTTTTVPKKGVTLPTAFEEETTTTLEETTTTTILEEEEVKIDIVELSIPSEIYAFESFTLGVKVRNAGTTEGSDRITLSLPEGWDADRWSKIVHLSAGEEKVLYFTITPSDESGIIVVGSSSDFEKSEKITPLRKAVTTAQPLAMSGFMAALYSIDWMITGVTSIILIVIFLFLFRKKIFRKKKR